jgi:hypothetical protein
METWTIAEVNSVIWFLLAIFAHIMKSNEQWKEVYYDGVLRVQHVRKMVQRFLKWADGHPLCRSHRPVNAGRAEELILEKPISLNFILLTC